MRVAALGRRLSLAAGLAGCLTLWAGAPIAAAETPAALDNCRFCVELSRQFKEPAEQAVSLELCHILSGALHQLGDRRAAFLRHPRYIDLFPLGYWQVTRIELQRLHDGDFAHPIEKMQQMLMYLDAYHRNRERWLAAHAGEFHWQRHFRAAMVADLETRGVGFGMVLDTPRLIERVLGLANSAHVEFDFPRAIRDSFAQRYHPALSADQLHPDFVKTNATLRAATASSSAEIFAAVGRRAVWRPVLISTVAVGWWDRMVAAMSGWVIERRAAAWETAFGVRPLPTGEEPSPLTDHAWLAQIGRQYCSGEFRDIRQAADDRTW
jgi:hypothetical protein